MITNRILSERKKRKILTNDILDKRRSNLIKKMKNSHWGRNAI